MVLHTLSRQSFLRLRSVIWSLVECKKFVFKTIDWGWTTSCRKVLWKYRVGLLCNRRDQISAAVLHPGESHWAYSLLLLPTPGRVTCTHDTLRKTVSSRHRVVVRKKRTKHGHYDTPVWTAGGTVRALDLRLKRSRVRISVVLLSGKNLRQVVHTRVPVSSSSIIWYRSRGDDVLWLGR